MKNKSKTLPEPNGDALYDKNAKILDRGSCGITSESIDFFNKNVSTLGKIKKIEISLETFPATTLLYGQNGKIMVLTGFSFGYTGEGSRGFEWLVRTINQKNLGGF